MWTVLRSLAQDARRSAASEGVLPSSRSGLRCSSMWVRLRSHSIIKTWKWQIKYVSGRCFGGRSGSEEARPLGLSTLMRWLGLLLWGPALEAGLSWRDSTGPRNQLVAVVGQQTVGVGIGHHSGVAGLQTQEAALAARLREEVVRFVAAVEDVAVGAELRRDGTGHGGSSGGTHLSSHAEPGRRALE
jgi:hypothetical protein